MGELIVYSNLRNCVPNLGMRFLESGCRCCGDSMAEARQRPATGDRWQCCGRGVVSERAVRAQRGGGGRRAAPGSPAVSARPASRHVAGRLQLHAAPTSHDT